MCKEKEVTSWEASSANTRPSLTYHPLSGRIIKSNRSTCSQLSEVCVCLCELVVFPTRQQQQQQQVPGCWLTFSLMGAMVTSGEWEHSAVNNWRGVCYTVGPLAPSKVSCVPAQTLICFRISKQSFDGIAPLWFHVCAPQSVGVLTCYSVWCYQTRDESQSILWFTQRLNRKWYCYTVHPLKSPWFSLWK